MKRAFIHKLAFVVFLAALAANASGDALFERSFAEMGYPDFVVQGARQRGCSRMEFLLPDDVNVLDAEVYPILSLGTEFGPVQQGIVDVNVYLNGKRVAELGALDFKCGEACWERLLLEKGLLEQNRENGLRVCMKTSDSTTRAVLKAGSGVGLYKTADFSRENGFVVSAEKYDLVIGEKVKVSVLIHNQGSASSFAEVKHARALAEDKNAFFVVEGKTSFKGFVNAGEEQGFAYVIKPRALGGITPPPAILYYRNEFGEEEAVFSNLVHFAVREPERKVEAFIVKQREAGTVGEKIGLQLAVKNVGQDPLFDLGIALQLPEGLDFVEEPAGLVLALQPNEAVLLPFSVVGSGEGRFAVGCTVSYTDLNVVESKCSDSSLLFEQPAVAVEIYAGTGLLVVALVVYLYIMRGK